MENERGFLGVWIPKEIYLHKELTPTEKLLLAEITALHGSGSCFASNQHFSEFLGISKSQVSRLLTKLARMNFISVEIVYINGTKEVDKRFLTPIGVDSHTPTHECAYPLRIDAYTPTHENVYPIRMDAYINNNVKEQEKEQIKEKKKTNKKKSASNSEYEKEFETLWASYPKKKNRKDALLSYIKARKTKNYTYETIKIGLERYIEQLELEGTEPQYILNGSTFFNQERFNDEYNIVGLKKKPKGALDLYYKEFGGQENEYRGNAQVVDLYPPILPEPFQERGF